MDGPAEAVKEETRKVIEDFGRTHFILGADCTLATEQDMDLSLIHISGTLPSKGPSRP